MEFNVLLSFAVFIIGCVLISIILYRHRLLSARLLCFSLFTLAYSILLIFMFDSHYILYFPYLFRTGGMFGYLIAPSLYLYVMCVLHDRHRFQWKDAIHLLPAFVYLVDYMPFLLTSNEHKLKMLQALFTQPQAVLFFREGWLVPSGWHNIARTAIAFIYFFFLAKELFVRDYYKSRLHHRREVLTWLRIVTILYFVLNSLGIVTILLLPSPLAWPLTILNILIIFLVISLMLFLNPHVLYGAYDEADVVQYPPEKSKPQALPGHLSEQVGFRLRSFIREQQFLQKNIKLDEMASELEIKPYVLSAYINQEYQMHFNDLINYHRIQYIKEGIMNDQWDDLTLEAIAEKAGFSNRNTFLSAFKKATGMTPTNFIRIYRQSHSKKGSSSGESANI